MRTITIIGIAGNQISEESRRLLSEATLVIGARRHLNRFRDLISPSATTIELGPLPAALAAIHSTDEPTVILASGDPGWFGIVGTISTHTSDPLQVIPAPSCLSLLAAARGQPWDHIVTYSAHGRDPRPAVNAARALPAVAVLTGPGLTVSDLATALDGWPRLLTIGQRLGHPDQQVTTCLAAEAATQTWAVPNIVLVTDPTRKHITATTSTADRGWALPETEYEHRNGMITKAETRAVVLARLAPATGRLIWDIGAGSGSVGIECARQGAAVICIESDPASAERISHNAHRHNAAVRIVTGPAPPALTGLPTPDAAFIGGGGPEVTEAVTTLDIPRLVVACAALDHALTARTKLRSAGYTVEGVQMAASRLVELPDGAVRLAAINPTIVLTANRPTANRPPADTPTITPTADTLTANRTTADTTGGTL